MITVLTGENDFETKRALEAIASSFEGTVERIDGVDLELSRLPEMLTGMTLFADKRLVVITDLSGNKTVWNILPDWLPKIGDDIHVVLVEQKPDKRTKTYKDLKKLGDFHEFGLWGDRDTQVAERWCIYEFAKIAADNKRPLSKEAARELVARVGVDQWALYHALQKLAVLAEVNPRIIDRVIAAAPSENVFNLLDAALRGDAKKVQTMIQTLQRTQDPYMTFGLLSGQVFQLAALAVSEKSSNEVASDIGAHPYALGKLLPHAKKLDRGEIRKIVAAFADADSAMKSSAVDPWLLIERALIKTTTV